MKPTKFPGDILTNFSVIFTQFQFVTQQYTSNVWTI